MSGPPGVSGETPREQNLFVTAAKQVRKKTAAVVDGVNVIATNSVHLYTVSLLIQCIFEEFIHLKVKNEGVKTITRVLTDFTEFVEALLVVMDLKKMLIRDENNELIWDKSLPEVIEHMFWTGAHGLQSVRFLNYLKVVRMSTQVVGMMTTLISAMKIVAALFNIGLNGFWIYKSSVKKEKGSRKISAWRGRVSNWTKDASGRAIVCNGKITKLQERLKIEKVEERKVELQDKIAELTEIKDSTEESRLSRYCEAKAAKWASKNKQETKKQVRSVLSIAFDVFLIAAMTLCIVGQWTPVGTPFAAMLSLMYILATIPDVGNIFVENFWKLKPIPAIRWKQIKPIPIAT